MTCSVTAVQLTKELSQSSHFQTSPSDSGSTTALATVTLQSDRSWTMGLKESIASHHIFHKSLFFFNSIHPGRVHNTQPQVVPSFTVVVPMGFSFTRRSDEPVFFLLLSFSHFDERSFCDQPRRNFFLFRSILVTSTIFTVRVPIGFSFT